MVEIADKKLTEVTIAKAAKDSDYFVLLQDKAVKQIALSSLDLGGGEVMEIELRKNEGYVEWRTKGSNVWHRLFALSEVKGEPGKNGADGNDGADGKPGKDGVTPTFAIGTVETVENGQPARVTITGTSENVTLNFQIPKGLDGTGAGDVTTAQLQAAIKENVTDKNFLQSSTAELTYAKKTDIENFVTDEELNSSIDSNINSKGFLTSATAHETYIKKTEVESFATDTELNEAIKVNVTDKGFLQSSVAEQTYIKKDSIDTNGLLTQELAEKTYAKKTEVSNEISTHNTEAESHNDIRLLITGLTNRLNALADSDDQSLDQLSEIVAYIKSNKELIDDITTSKVSVDSIVDNLSTNVANLPLSAAQGVALKALINAIVVPTLLSQLQEDATHRTVTDTEKSTWNNKSNFSGSWNDLTEKPTLITEQRVIELIDSKMPASAERRQY